jgi:hypothetical protein
MTTANREYLTGRLRSEYKAAEFSTWPQADTWRDCVKIAFVVFGDPPVAKNANQRDLPGRQVATAWQILSLDYFPC